MNVMKIGGALALSLLVAACGGKDNANVGNRAVPVASQAVSQTGETYSGTGTVTAIEGDRVTISHGPIEGIGWPAMTMGFAAGSPDMVEGVRVGDRVSVAFTQGGSAFTLTSVAKQ